MSSATRVLALSMRPKSLSELIGQDDLIDSLSTQFATGRIPHFFLITAPIGAGKTTFARIISLWLQVRTFDFSDQQWRDFHKYEIKEINAANNTGIDDMRKVIDAMRFQPLRPSRVKVVILDEAHQLSTAAQNALITETEDVAEHVFYIFCTSAVNKIIPALKRRAFIVSPKPLSHSAVEDLIHAAQSKVNHSMDTKELVSALIQYDVSSPGLVLQAVERFLSGLSAEDSVLAQSNSMFDSMAVCRAIAAGDWAKCCALTKNITKSDVYALRACLTGYLKAILIKSSGEKAMAISKAIVNLSSSCAEDSVLLPAFMANLFMACNNMNSTRTVKGTRVTVTK